MAEVGDPEEQIQVETDKKQRVAIVVLGRGVGVKPGSDLDKVRAGRGDLIEPTGYLERAVVSDPSKGDFGPEQHPVFNEPVEVGAEPTESRYAGAKANIEAAQEIVKAILGDKNRELAGICFAAGRTPDMKEYASEGWTQGMVLAKDFLDGVPDLTNSGIRFVFEPENVNTYDDLAASLLWAQKEGCSEVIMVTVGIHMKRTYLMTRAVLEGMRREFGEGNIPQVRFLASEPLVMKKGEERKAEVREVMESRGHNVTLAREQRGVEQVKSGTYQSQWASGGKVHEFDKPVQVMSVAEVRDFK
jgi:hypothetical protein